MATQPPAIGTIPTPPDFVNRQSTAHAEAVAMFNALKIVAPQINSVGQITYSNAVSVELAAAVANATQWASGSYATGAAVWSPIASAAGTPAVYIRKAPGGASPTDPANDSTNWVKYNPSNTNGFASLSGQNIILDRNSPYCIQVNSSVGARITLSENPINNQSGVRHIIKNASNVWSVRVFNPSGYLLGFLSPQSLAQIYFDGTSWGGDLESYGVSAAHNWQGTIPSISNIIDAIEIDDDRTLFLIGGKNGSALLSFIFDSSIAFIGNIIQVRASAHHAKAVKTNDGNILVVSCDNAANMQAVVVGVSGAALTIGTPTPETIGSNILSFGQLINNNGNYVLSYSRDNSGNKYGVVRGIAISGNPILGTEVVLTGHSSEAPRLYQSGAMVRTLLGGRETGGEIYAAAFNQSGATLSAAGSPAYAPSSFGFSGGCKSVKMPNGNIAALHYSAGYFKVSIFSNSGGNESCYSAVVADIYAGGDPGSVSLEIEPFSTNKLAVFATASTYPNLFVSTVTDDGGSATALNLSISTPHNGGELSFLFGASFLSDYFGVALTYPSYSYKSQSYYFNFSSAPAFYHYVDNGNLSSETKPAPRGSMGELDGSMLQNNSGVFNFRKTIDGDIYSPVVYGFLGRHIDGKPFAKINSRPSVRGKNNRVAYSIGAGNNGYGFAIERIELQA